MAPRKTLFERLADAKVEKDLATAKYDELVELAREKFDVGVHGDDHVQISVQVNRTWDKKAALKKYGDSICTPQVDMALAREVLTGRDFDALYNYGDNRVVVKVL